jgi:hypothetical protein
VERPGLFPGVEPEIRTSKPCVPGVGLDPTSEVATFPEFLPETFAACRSLAPLPKAQAHPSPFLLAARFRPARRARENRGYVLF